MGTILRSMFVTQSIWGRPLKFLVVLLSLLTLPLGALMWGVLVEHGMAVLAKRAAERVRASRSSDSSGVLCGSLTGVVLDYKAREIVYFWASGKELPPLGFDRLESVDWEWIDSGGRRTKNKLVLQTTDVEHPTLTIQYLSEADARDWQRRLNMLPSKPTAG